MIVNFTKPWKAVALVKLKGMGENFFYGEQNVRIHFGDDS